MRRLWSLSLLLGCVACLPMAVEQHGGLSPVPSKVPDAGFIGLGFALDGGLQLAHVPAVPRVLADVLAAWTVRNVSTFGRSVDSGFLMVFGAIPAEIGGVTLYSLKHPTHPDCTISRGPDTAVTRPVAARELTGRMWGGQCLTWDEERHYRHVN